MSTLNLRYDCVKSLLNLQDFKTALILESFDTYDSIPSKEGGTQRMNNQWRDNANKMVVWADGTYDTSRSCDECQRPNCGMAVHADHYKEIGESRFMTDEAEDQAGKSYWNWMAVNKPLGSRQDFDGEWVHTELFTANPDGLSEPEPRSSGTNKDIYELAKKAFAQLTPKQQEVWQLVMREQVSETEAARRLNISQPTVNQHLKYAKTKFAEYMRNNNVSA